MKLVAIPPRLGPPPPPPPPPHDTARIETRPSFSIDMPKKPPFAAVLVLSKNPLSPPPLLFESSMFLFSLEKVPRHLVLADLSPSCPIIFCVSWIHGVSESARVIPDIVLPILQGESIRIRSPYLISFVAINWALQQEPPS